MTNGWIDIKNTDMMLIMGGNPAENHPCGFKWAIEAKIHRNAKTIVVDPRLTRTAATADMYVQIRAGSDIAFLGGVINYAIQNNRIAHAYLVHYTNAAFIIKDGFKLPDDGLYSGFDPVKQTYDKATWNYEEGGDLTGKPVLPTPASQQPHVQGSDTGQGQGYQAASPAGAKGGAAPAPILPPKIAFDLSLQHPRCVFQLLKKQYERYTPEMVERITGIPQEQFLKAADLYTSVRKDGDMKKVSTIIYAVGWTQHSFGTQIIRTAAMLQLLMGNIGRAGGGVNALRGHSNIQGATDMAGIFDILPGYLKMPNPGDVDLATYLKRITSDTLQARSVGFVQLLVEHFEVCGVVPQSDVRSCGYQRERLRISLFTKDRPQLFVGEHLERHVRRQDQRHLRLRHERRDDRSGLPEKHRRLEKGRLAGGLRNLSR